MEEFGVDVELIKGSGGVFDVVVDGELIYSKHVSGNQFPSEVSIVKLLKEKEG